MNTTAPDASPYQAPQGELLTEDANQVGEIKFFSANCRIGRLRYFAHATLMVVVLYSVMGLAAGIGLGVLGESTIGPAIFGLIMLPIYIGVCWYSFIVMIQRLHDQDLSGWLSLLMLVPLANMVIAIMLMFIPGTPDVNRFGPPPPPNKTWHWIVALVMPVVAVVGILAAVALPFYMDYTDGATAYSQDGAIVETYDHSKQNS